MHHATKKFDDGTIEQHWYIICNKTPLLRITDPVYVSVLDLIQFITLPCEPQTDDKAADAPFSPVTEWHQGIYDQIMGSKWGFAMLHELTLTGNLENVTTVLLPKSLPISFGYNWGSFPILYEEPGNWENILLNRVDILNYVEHWRRSIWDDLHNSITLVLKAWADSVQNFSNHI